MNWQALLTALSPLQWVSVAVFAFLAVRFALLALPTAAPIVGNLFKPGPPTDQQAFDAAILLARYFVDCPEGEKHAREAGKWVAEQAGKKA